MHGCIGHDLFGPFGVFASILVEHINKRMVADKYARTIGGAFVLECRDFGMGSDVIVDLEDIVHHLFGVDISDFGRCLGGWVCQAKESAQTCNRRLITAEVIIIDGNMVAF